jgi:hypothetical protein
MKMYLVLTYSDTPEISDAGSLCNSSDKNSGNESLALDKFDGTNSDNDDAAQLLESLQKLYTLFLHPNKRRQMQKMMVSIECHAENLHLLTDSSKAKSWNLSRSEARKGIIYTEDSHTSDWQKRKR